MLFPNAVFKNICRKAGVPYQTYANRSDIAGGSTLGNISNSHISINTVDIGLAQLAMHSAIRNSRCKGYRLYDSGIEVNSNKR